MVYSRRCLVIAAYTTLLLLLFLFLVLRYVRQKQARVAILWRRQTIILAVSVAGTASCWQITVRCARI